MQTRGLLSPSFNSYSNRKLAEVTGRVVEELREEENSGDVYGEFCPPQSREKEKHDSRIEEKEDNSDGVDENEDFEFAFVRESQISSPISADEIFCNGQIRPVFPMFNRDLFLERQNHSIENSGSLKGPGPGRKIRLPLRKLFTEERETASSDSSSEADELGSVPPETYCVWRQKDPAERCNKSNSSRSSKRWRFRDLLHRSHSDGGKETFVLFTPSKEKEKEKGKENEKIVKTKTPVDGGKVKSTAAAQHSKKGGDHRKSYLPYRRDLVGLFSNVNGLSRNLQPF